MHAPPGPPAQANVVPPAVPGNAGTAGAGRRSPPPEQVRTHAIRRSGPTARSSASVSATSAGVTCA